MCVILALCLRKFSFLATHGSLCPCLASAPTKEKNDFLSSLTKDPAWIGGNDLVEEGTWVWTDGSPWNYENWAKVWSGDRFVGYIQQPDNRLDREDFLVLNGNNKMTFWTDHSGEWDRWGRDNLGVYGFICQYDPNKNCKNIEQHLGR